MSRFSQRLNRPGVAWDLFADLEPVLRSVEGLTSLAVEVLDSTGAHTSTDIASARTGLVERAATPIRITATVEAVADNSTAETYSVSVWASEVDSSTGIVVTGQSTATEKAAMRRGEVLLYELWQQISTFAKHHDIRRGQGDSNDPNTELEPRTSRARVRQFLSTQAIALIGGVLASLFAAAILAWAAWWFSR